MKNVRQKETKGFTKGLYRRLLCFTASSPPSRESLLSPLFTQVSLLNSDSLTLVPNLYARNDSSYTSQPSVIRKCGGTFSEEPLRESSNLSPVPPPATKSTASFRRLSSWVAFKTDHPQTHFTNWEERALFFTANALRSPQLRKQLKTIPLLGPKKLTN